MDHHGAAHLDQHPITQHLNWFGVPRFWRKVFIISAIALFVEAGVVFGVTHSPLVNNNVCISADSSTCLLHAEVVDSPQDIEKGLSNRAYLDKDKSMLFSFQNAGVHCFWMKDMHFPLDIIWLSSTRQIQHIEPNVPVDSYPNNYCPAVDAKYVLEINAGQAQKLGLQVGQVLDY